MASLDAARAGAAALGAFDEALLSAASAAAAVAQLPGLQIMTADSIDAANDVPSVDPLKLTIAVGGLNITGALARRKRRTMLPVNLLKMEYATCEALNAVQLVNVQLVLAGYQAANELAAQGIAIELATSSIVLAAFGAGSTRAHAARLVSALNTLCREHELAARQQRRFPAEADAPWPLGDPAMRMTPREAHFAPSERYPLAAAA